MDTKDPAAPPQPWLRKDYRPGRIHLDGQGEHGQKRGAHRQPHSGQQQVNGSLQSVASGYWHRHSSSFATTKSTSSSLNPGCRGSDSSRPANISVRGSSDGSEPEW
jgi:hypothetical protein